jgi:nitroreductase
VIDKSADNQYPIHELLQQRWSPRAFLEQPIEREKLLSILEAARWAASSGNEQPWSFIVATQENRVDYQRLLHCLKEANQQWAQTAPVLMLSIAKLYREKDGQDNRHSFYDVGAAVTSLTFQATALGLFVRQVAGFNVEKAREMFKIPKEYEPVVAIAIGYLGESQILPEKLQQRELAPRSRKPLNTFVFGNSWGETSPLITCSDLQS